MKRILSVASVLSLVLLTSQCGTSRIAVKKDALERTKVIALLPFTANPGVDPKAASDCMESFQGILLDSGFTLSERANVDKVLKEKALALSGLTQDQTVELGQLLAAQAVLVGQVTECSESTNKENVALSEYGPDRYDAAKDPKDGTFFQKEGAWYKRSTLRAFRFQLYVKLVSTVDGQVIFTLQNEYPVRKFELDGWATPADMAAYRSDILKQMGVDLKKALRSR